MSIALEALEPPVAAASCAQMLAHHREVWGRKATLRRAYEEFFALVRSHCSPHRPVVELGCGPGLLKSWWPEVLATDVVATPWAERVVDATALPFLDHTVGNVVMVDVFHHLAAPMEFLNEAARVLLPGGRVVMIEPWTSPLGYLFYKYVHHEDADRSVDRGSPFSAGKDPMDGNAALPELHFGPAAGHDPHPALRRIELRRLPAIPWLLSGGFQEVSLLPSALWPVAKAIDWMATPLARWVALRALIVLERS